MHQNLAIELNESNEVLQTKWKGLTDCYKKYREAEKLTGDKSRDCTNNRWCWAEALQFLESCRWNKASTLKISETSVFVSSVELHPVSTAASPQPESITCIPTECVETVAVHKPCVEAKQEDPKPKPKPPAFIQATSTEESARLLEPPCKRKWGRSYSTSADNGNTDSALIKRERRGRTLGPIDLLFKSYIETFKTLSTKKQASLKIKLAKLFANAEMDELEVLTDSVVSETDDQDSVLSSDLDLIIKH